MRVKRKILPIIACLLLISQPIGCAANHTDIKSESTASTASDSESRNTTENTEVQTESSTSEPSSESPASSASAAANSTNSEASSSVSSETSSEASSEAEKAPLLSDVEEESMTKAGIPEDTKEQIRKLVAEGKTFKEAVKTFYPNATFKTKTVETYKTVSSPAQDSSEETQSNEEEIAPGIPMYDKDYLDQSTEADYEALRKEQKNNPVSGPSDPIEDPGITLH
ncbi:MAG: hypothetical protein ACFWUC_03105 [Oscillospiraceae bacterium]